MSEMSFGGRVAEWAEERNLIEGSTPRLQMTKLFEECEELSHALQDDDLGETIDAIGDIQVVLAVMCAQLGLSIDECREVAWNEIKDRKGKMVDGVFVKEGKVDQTNNGGPAFPNDYCNPSSQGMSLRDWFAGQALAGQSSIPRIAWSFKDIAELAYEQADAMLAERQKERG